MTHLLRAAFALFTSLLAACGGQVVFEPSGEGGGGGAPPTSSSIGTSTATGILRCGDHTDCGPTQLCIFATGECATACETQVDCAVDEVCYECATASCFNCRDCRAACVAGDDPPPPPQPYCTSHEDCAANGLETLCLFDLGRCARACGPAQPPCPPSQSCDDCGTSSCPGCENCVAACRP